MLRPGGLAVYYYGNLYLPALIREMERAGLRYLWTFCHPYAPNSLRTINHLGIEQSWKPVVAFAKGEWRSDRKIPDMLLAFPREKGRDYWEQSLPLLEYLLETFSEAGDTVLDPLAGTYTIMEACFNKDRKCIACDSDPAARCARPAAVGVGQAWDLRRPPRRRGGRGRGRRQRVNVSEENYCQGEST